MKIRFALLALTCTCISAPAAMAAKHTIVYSFGGSPDGANPHCSLVELNGIFYGTTAFGGKYGFGTVFSLTPGGTETVLHSFGGEGLADGYLPYSALVAHGGTLYGVTDYGGTGAQTLGTVFSIKPDGTYAVLYSFTGGSDGANPIGSLAYAHGTLYGTTMAGGAANLGTLFAITPAGKESVLHTFQGGNDGANPQSSLIAVHGQIYGTTSFGGASGNGTVFSFANGQESIVYAFQGSPHNDGSYPLYPPLTELGGTLYGTTYEGCDANEQGCVFSLTPAGVETVLYAFAGKPDGASPLSSLLPLNGEFYGTTAEAGAHKRGTIFQVSPSGAESVLYSFINASDGEYPQAGLIESGGVLYGTTYDGGAFGGGTVFSFTP
jgi:uncharacterized repeat protein (TIGR03803 family)